MLNHEHFMQMALDLAAKGWPEVVPNPLVGCVIVQGNHVLASGYHHGYGKAHAEVEAINALPAAVSPSDCVLYVTLEPCSHFGKTPPCADLIIHKGFKKVVVACTDPNPMVAGRGLRKLEEAGIEIVQGVLEKEARFINRRFFCFHENKRPYISLKWAVTADGFMSKRPLPQRPEENWISGREAKVLVHKLRSEVQAIMVGKVTVLNDNPNLTTRLIKGKNPIRVFIDKDLEVPSNFNIYSQQANTIVFNQKMSAENEHITYIKFDFERNVLGQIMDHLHTLQIQTLLVEGGAFLLNSLIEQNLWDEILVIENPNLQFKAGIMAPQMPAGNVFDVLGTDKLYRYYRMK
ncbi:MAG: bifunctional diaminohydroxyphosphoribosylaminopyrimidine deaminase/5-amino-6-(5-phosphoribosylamino)uracil reductase RibD [bacterium]|nr:bifunctional diaminohydroxyphosphoribosylaminopyrimidine deaminase/5-amino-6-(5-phosphoribosylamino)uracil reductase RibD [bacterium]